MYERQKQQRQRRPFGVPGLTSAAGPYRLTLAAAKTGEPLNYHFRSLKEALWYQKNRAKFGAGSTLSFESVPST